MLKILEISGFAELEAKVYVYLAKRGPQTAREITLGLRISKQKLNPILSSLREKGVVVRYFKPVTQFSALSFEKVIDIQIKKNSKSSTIHYTNQRRITIQLAKHRNIK